MLFTNLQIFSSVNQSRGYFALNMAERLMDEIGVKSCMVVGEIGIGKGEFAFKLAQRVGAGGKIFANEINKKNLEMVSLRCKNENISNMEIVLGSEDNPNFAERSLDLAIMIHVFHDLTKPVGFLENLKSHLKPGASLVIVDFKSMVTEENLIKLMKGTGFILKKSVNFIPNDYILIFQAKE